VISDHIGSLGIRIDADLWSLVNVDQMGGMYVRICMASVAYNNMCKLNMLAAGVPIRFIFTSTRFVVIEILQDSGFRIS